MALESCFTTLIEYSNYSVQIENTVFGYKCILSIRLSTLQAWSQPGPGVPRLSGTVVTRGNSTRQPRTGRSEPRTFKTRQMWD